MKKVKKTSKKFIGFLLVSALIWFLITLSKEYVTTITFPIVYKNLPQNKLLQTAPIKEIVLQIKATGFKIIRSKFIKKPISLNTSNLSKKSSRKYYFLASNQKMNIQKQLLSQVLLQEILLDTVYLELGSLISKKIPLVSNLDITYHIGYDIIEPIRVAPDSVVISGPETQIEKIKFLNLKTLKLSGVKSNFTEKVAIIKPVNSKSIKLNLNAVAISGKVEKFTEGSFNVPFRVVNLPENIELNTLSKTVEVIFIVGLSSFYKVDKNSFVVECDFKVSQKNNLSYLIPKVVEKPDLIKSFRIIPNKIDFLIQK